MDGYKKWKTLKGSNAPCIQKFLITFLMDMEEGLSPQDLKDHAHIMKASLLKKVNVLINQNVIFIGVVAIPCLGSDFVFIMYDAETQRFFR